MDKKEFQKIEESAKWRLLSALHLVDEGILTPYQYYLISKTESEKVRIAEEDYLRNDRK